MAIGTANLGMNLVILRAYRLVPNGMKLCISHQRRRAPRNAWHSLPAFPPDIGDISSKNWREEWAPKRPQNMGFYFDSGDHRSRESLDVVLVIVASAGRCTEK
jgi:hypothetical protein